MYDHDIQRLRSNAKGYGDKVSEESVTCFLRSMGDNRIRRKAILSTDAFGNIVATWEGVRGGDSPTPHITMTFSSDDVVRYKYHKTPTSEYETYVNDWGQGSFSGVMDKLCNGPAPTELMGYKKPVKFRTVND